MEQEPWFGPFSIRSSLEIPCILESENKKKRAGGLYYITQSDNKTERHSIFSTSTIYIGESSNSLDGRLKNHENSFEDGEKKQIIEHANNTGSEIMFYIKPHPIKFQNSIVFSKYIEYRFLNWYRAINTFNSGEPELPLCNKDHSKDSSWFNKVTPDMIEYVEQALEDFQEIIKMKKIIGLIGK